MRIPSGKSGWTVRTGLRQPGRVGGFTYLSVLAIIDNGRYSVGEVWHMALKREKEGELLFVGDQFRRAIRLCYEHTSGRGRRYPERLEALLMDPRYPSAQRYLRKICPDPVSGSAKWGLVKGPAGKMYWVHGLAEEEPIKKVVSAPRTSISRAKRNT